MSFDYSYHEVMINLLLLLAAAFALVPLCASFRVAPNPRFTRSLSRRYAEDMPPCKVAVKLKADMIQAMKNKEKTKVAAVRSISTAIKQVEVDERIPVTDEMVVEIMSKLVKQRKESIKSYGDAGREDLVAIEQYEIGMLLSSSRTPKSCLSFLLPLLLFFSLIS